MRLGTQIAQEASGTLESTEATSGESAPLIDAEPVVLWSGFAGTLVLLCLILFFVFRSRMRHTAKARKALEQKAFFEPAGADAEITFDDNSEQDTPPPKKGFFGRKKKSSTTEAEIKLREGASTPAIDTSQAPEEATVSFTHEEETPTDERSEMDSARAEFEQLVEQRNTQEQAKREPGSTFANLFAKSRDEEKNAEARPPAEPDPDQLTSPDSGSLKDDPPKNSSLSANDETAYLQKAEEEREQRLRAEAEAKIALKRAEAAENQAAAVREQMAQSNLPPQGAASHQPQEFEARIKAVTDRLQTKLATTEMTLAEKQLETSDLVRALQSSSMKVMQQVDARLARVEEKLAVYGEGLKDQPSVVDPQETRALSKQISALTQHLTEGASHTAVAKVQLHELLKGALPAAHYEVQKTLKNGNTVDCFVSMPDKRAGIAIDARFPVDAYDEYVRTRRSSADEEKANNQFRSALLRHIVTVSERCISPDETRSSAFMFVPSETIYNEIQARFGDVVQDGYSANVWIVSPTSLVSTLHTLREFSKLDAAIESATIEEAQPLNTDLLDEIKALRERVNSLEEERAATITTTPPAPSPPAEPSKPQAEAISTPQAETLHTVSMSREEEAFERLERQEAEIEARERSTDLETSETPSFPLR